MVTASLLVYGRRTRDEQVNKMKIACTDFESGKNVGWGWEAVGVTTCVRELVFACQSQSQSLCQIPCQSQCQRLVDGTNSIAVPRAFRGPCSMVAVKLP